MSVKINEEISYEGCVLRISEKNGYDDSDFYALVWDEESQSTKSIMYATTRGWTYNNWAVVDATDEVKAKVYEQGLKVGYANAVSENITQAKQVAKGKRVVKVKGIVRTGKGKEGTIFWIRDDRRTEPKLGLWKTGTFRIGFKTDQGEAIWANSDQVEVLEFEKYLVEEDQLRINAKKWADYYCKY